MRISLCLLLFSVVHGGGCNEMEVAGIAEESVQLQPAKLPEPGTGITWKVTLDSAETYRIVTFNKGEPPDHGAAPHFINRVTFHPENLSLQIDPVNKSDSGLYTLLIDIGGGREDITKFRVSVFDRVRQPNLTVLSAHAELGQCNVTLSCSVPGADRVTYGWSRGTSQIPSDRDHQLPGHQSLLHVVINANSSDAFYRCNASNRASWGADTVDVKSLCDSPPAAPTPGIKQQDFFQKVPLWAIVAAGLGLLLLLTTLTLIFLCKHRKKQRSCKDGDPPITIYEEVEDACPRRNANGNAQNRIVGNTIYAEINCNSQPPSVKRNKINPSFISTIYAEVQDAPSRPRQPQKQRTSSPNPGHLYS
ncbi:natural killer cell receptor 2B4 isoform X3 [Chrysemys picta bellii]|uniref:natural killer cell receptor 2B4 isoform X3 n=1 Tax=Chrysemys picta bellii TaxID=8478 RepID=UPI0032B2CAF5